MTVPGRTEAKIEFDHHRPVSEQDPDLAYSALRASRPIAWTGAHGGFWVVTRHQDVFNILRDYRNFSSRDGMAIPAHKGGDYTIPVALDPPEHAPYRRAMNPFMTKEAVQERLLPRLQHWTNHYIDRVIERGSCDLAYDLAVPIPGAVTLEWVGWEDCDEWDRISEAWHDLLAYPLDHPKTARSHDNLRWFTVRIGEEIEKRRVSPRDDIISHVASLEVGGKPLSDQQAVSMITIWVAGGVDTTTTFILAGLLHLLRNPEHKERLISDETAWDGAMDEILRRYPPTRTTTRTVVDDIEFGGFRMKAGDRVLVSLSGANLDPDIFAAPDAVDLDRARNPHVAFGAGAHRCVGMHLARQEFRTIVGEILRRMPDLALTEPGIVEYQRQSEMRGWTSVPARFAPARAFSPPEK